MPKAFWNGAMLAQSNLCRIVEGRYFFPPESVHSEYLRASSTHTISDEKSVADYFDIEVDGEVNRDAAWCFRDAYGTTEPIAQYIVFSDRVSVVD